MPAPSSRVQSFSFEKVPHEGRAEFLRAAAKVRARPLLESPFRHEHRSDRLQLVERFRPGLGIILRMARIDMPGVGNVFAFREIVSHAFEPIAPTIAAD